ncbi:multiple sugar transport system substrate-binding protein [Butyrivibrio fibrisolvens DSM 3071]|uniref:Multiple sugar transport system substrate-binding protein n=1 Tax=Butyrivibrio fibrisolvens DSM 3071 TaxID=1121131 RepID=A0A1M6GCL8_BUTFI|nr:ABC transporter substrate-binding protein [Butyrivibrio fibrisolvens]SHJ07644.1 multiple sugar transport system substrate-binding protein [Butyrivibrio fibrisolvens DSM 3071]
MSKHITKIISTALVIMLVLGTAGCSQSTNKSKEFTPKYSSDTTYKLSVAGTYSNFESLESVFERFYTYYPNGEIVYTYLDDYSNTIGQALAGQEPPDIYVVQPWMYGDERFDPLFDGAEVLSDPELNINLDCIRQGLRWEMNDGEILALPVFATSYGMLVNMDIFEKENLEVPKTFGELKETCEKLKAAGYASPVMGADTNTTPGIGYSFAYPMFAKKVKDDRSVEGDLNNLVPSAGEVMREPLTRLKELVDSGCIDIDKCKAEIEDDYNAVIMRFFEGDVPMMICSGDVVSGTKKRESKSEAFTANPFKYDFYVAPSGDDGGYYMDSMSILFSVNKNSDSLDMTNEFIRFLTSEKELGLMAQEKRLITPTKDYSLDEVYASLSGFPEDRTVNFRDTEILDTAVKEFRAAAYAVINGEMTVDEAVAAYGTIAGK